LNFFGIIALSVARGADWLISDRPLRRINGIRDGLGGIFAQSSQKINGIKESQRSEKLWTKTKLAAAVGAEQSP